MGAAVYRDINGIGGVLKNDETLLAKDWVISWRAMADRNSPLVTRDYINLQATRIAKLAYTRGLHTTQESSLIVKEMLPVKPLNHYQRHAFFNELL